VKNVEVSRDQYDTNTILANANLAIGYPMESVVNGLHGIEPLDIDWQELPADANNAYRWLADVTHDNRCYRWWPMFYQW
jgi:hypothetical protein